MTPATRARIGRWALRVALVLAAGWGGLAIYYALTGNAFVRAGWVASWCAMAVAALWGLRRGRENWALVGIFSAAFVVLAVSWWMMQPSQDRDWADDVAQRLQPQVQEASSPCTTCAISIGAARPTMCRIGRRGDTI